MRDETREEVRSAIRTLPSGQRAALELADLGGVPYKRAARMLSLSPAGFKTSRHRARRALASRLSYLDEGGPRRAA